MAYVKQTVRESLYTEGSHLAQQMACLPSDEDIRSDAYWETLGRLAAEADMALDAPVDVVAERSVRLGNRAHRGYLVGMSDQYHYMAEVMMKGQV